MFRPAVDGAIGSACGPQRKDADLRMAQVLKNSPGGGVSSSLHAGSGRWNLTFSWKEMEGPWHQVTGQPPLDPSGSWALRSKANRIWILPRQGVVIRCRSIYSEPGGVREQITTPVGAQLRHRKISAGARAIGDGSTGPASGIIFRVDGTKFVSLASPSTGELAGGALTQGSGSWNVSGSARWRGCWAWT
ncbi:uncharacterized protein BJX67DRAFT_219223 [Aspergillus lucknowensis]|uniref:Uncharacterized protein n=1 Tax=Aspergillus lucknowensis TaxID=176173 RepID=A0ABR4M3T0_9EURO